MTNYNTCEICMVHTINQVYVVSIFMNYFKIKDLTCKIVYTFVLFAGALLLGIGAAVWAERTDTKKEETASGQDTMQVTTQLPNKETIKRVALTFDDGPNAIYTPILLDGLKERGVKVSFFVLGEAVEQHPKIVQRAHEEGHLIGVHAYEHVDLYHMSDAEAVAQVDRTNAAICAVTGVTAMYIRPPYGRWKEELEYEVQMIEALWDIDPRDWDCENADEIVRCVLKEVTDGSIILMHDASKSSVQAALTIVDALQEQDYEFVTIDALIAE